MSTVLEDGSLPHAARQGGVAWIAVLAGLLLLYVPTYIDLAHGLWRDDAYAHGPIILGVFAWLVWRRREILLDSSLAPSPVAGGLLLAAGLALYFVGRTQSLTVFEVASHLPVIAGTVLLLRGTRGLRAFGFAIGFLLFVVPLPGFVLDTLTTPLKEFVSIAVEGLLAALGYPVEREGVVLFVGNHQMLVADACSGLNSLYSLLAMGLLYTHLVGPRSRLRTTLVSLAVVPIAVVANILRVLALVLVTYHFGEEAGQGLVHSLAGMLVFVSAFAMLVAFDGVVRRYVAPGGERAAKGNADTDAPRSARGARIVPAVVAGLAMALTAAAAPVMKPVPSSAAAPDLETLIPASFGDWKIDPEVVPLAPAPDVQANLDRLYRQVVSRTYVNASGERMMLTVAHGGDQSDALKAHRQEACYKAQGFEIQSLSHGTLAASGRTIPVTRMHAVRGERSEPVTYWFTMGDRVVLGRLERLQVQLENGLAGRVPDGMLVRVSNISGDAAASYKAQESFVAAILAAVPSGDATRFVGAVRG